MLPRGRIRSRQIAVSDLSSTFTKVVKPDGTLLTDPFTDQQTGQKQADFISFTAGTTGVYLNNASTTTTISSDVPGFLLKSGTISGDATNTYLMFRFRFQDKNNTKDYQGSAVMLGADLTGDGKPDIIFGVDSRGTTPNLVFLEAGTGANDAPNTTTAASYTTTATTTLNKAGSPLTFGYAAAPETYTATGGGALQNMNLTFAITYTNLQQAIRDMGTVNGTNFSTFTVSASTEMAFVAYSSGQPNAFNQDIYGGNITNTTATTWTALGAFSSIITADGQSRIIPEPATFAHTGALLLCAGALLIRRRRQLRATAALPAPK